MPVSEDNTTMPDDGKAKILRDISRKREALAACPEGHPDRGQCAAELGSILCTGYRRFGDIALIKEGIKIEREALLLRPHGHPDRALSCSNLGVSLHAYYTQAGDIALLDEALELNRETLALLPQSHPGRVISCANLGSSLYVRYQQCGDVDLLDEALEIEREVLTLRPPGHSSRAVSCNNLATVLHACYQQCGDLTLFDEAIELKREALALRPPGHYERAVGCNNLGSLLHARYEQCGDVTLLDEAIKLEREALALQPPGHPDRAASCNNLATSLHVHYEQCGNLTLLDEAIELEREALKLQSPGHPKRALRCANLAASLWARYQQYGDVTLLNEAIEREREALTLRPQGHPERASSCANLGSSLYARYQQCGDVNLLNEAIKLEREALTLQPPRYPSRAVSCGNLATSLHARYQQCGDLTLLDEAITLERECLALRPLGHPKRAPSCGNLSTLLQAFYNQCGDHTLLNQAIELDREALSLQPPGHPERSQSCINLSYSIMECYKQTKSIALLDEVIKLCSYALECDTSFNLKASRSFAILSQLHLISDTSHFSPAKALHYLDLSFGSEVDNIHDFIRHTTYNLSQLWRLSGIIWTPETRLLLCEIYVKTIDRLPLAVGFVLNTSSRLQILKSRPYIGTDACVAAVLAEQPAKAVEVLDRAHGLVWTQAMHQRDPQMKGAPPGLAAELAGHLRVMAAPRTQLDEPSHHYEDARHQRSTRIQALLREIRAKPGLERFMLGITYDTLREAARDHPIVMLAAGRGHAFALIMASAAENRPHALRLDLTSDDLHSLQSAAQEAGLRSRADTREGDAVDSRIGYKTSGLHVHHKPLRVLAKIWHKIVKPVFDHLQLEKATGRSRPRLHWCANGGFVFLPLHAAGIYQGPASDQVCCSDYVVSSYTPTVSALLRAQAQATSVAPSDVDMLLVGEDCARNPSLSRLWNVQKELESVGAIAKERQFGRTVETIAREATVQRVTEQVKSASFVHLACHGIQNQTNALESGFYLSDGKLTISKLMELGLDQPWLAYLSACETAKGDAKQPDQVMHLAAAMLFAGFKHVVATMWMMGDADGPELAEWFYDELMSSKTTDDHAVAYALDGAIQKLRAKEVPPQRWAPFIHMGA